MKRFYRSCYIITLTLAWVILAVQVQAKESTDKTLSPYFFIKGQEGVDSFPLKSTQVEVNVSGVIANVVVRQRYANTGTHVLHASYIFPGSTRAAVHGMTMQVGERRIVAKIKEKEKAREIFEKAKKQGKSASLLSQKRPNVFSMNVANILPGDEVTIELHYTELLVPVEGVYSFVYPTVVGPRYSNTPEEAASEKERWVQNPYLHEGEPSPATFAIHVRLNSGMPLQDLSCKSHDVIVSYAGSSEAEVALDTSKGFADNRDFILDYRLQGKQVQSGLLLYKGEKENYFLLMSQPPERVLPQMIPARDYVFILDVSGSMHGFPLDTAKELINRLISGLRPEDSFNLMLFAGSAQVLGKSSLPASPENVKKALAMIDRQDGGGGTELLPAMKKALALPRKEGLSRTMVVITDGYISTEREVFKAIQNNLQKSNLFAFGIGSSVNRHLIEGMAAAGQGEPFVVTEPADAPAVVRHFREYVASPVLTDIKAHFNTMAVHDVEPPQLPDLFASRPVLLFGKWDGKMDGSLSITGKGGDGEYRQEFQLREANVLDDEGLEFLWARSRIARLSLLNDGGEEKKEITSLGLTHHLLTAYTSFVAVDEVVRNPQGNGKNVKQPLPLPKGVGDTAIGAHQVPEPEFATFVPLFLLVAGYGLYRRRRRV